jgi:hypothetical protein
MKINIIEIHKCNIATNFAHIIYSEESLIISLDDKKKKNL